VTWSLTLALSGAAAAYPSGSAAEPGKTTATASAPPVRPAPAR
jgi:hypothetical protein